ncbi:hypothetical protein HEP87_60425 [Streptomyces sp. S1D4-11]
MIRSAMRRPCGVRTERQAFAETWNALLHDLDPVLQGVDLGRQ